MIKISITERWRSFLRNRIEDIEAHHILLFLHDVLTLTEADLQLKLFEYLTELGYNPTFVNNGSESYIYALGKEPWLLVAHTDTVLPTPSQLFIKNELLGDNLFLLSGKGGLGADDRAGVAAMILYLAAGLRPSIFLPSGEEKGGLGTKAFIKNDMNVFADKINFMIQFDRQGTNDAVQYTDTNQTLMNIFTQEYFKKTFGSYTDISDLMPAYFISGLNLSIGYDKQHTSEETLDVHAFLCSIKAAYKTLTTMDLSIKHYYVQYVTPVIEPKPFTEYDYRYTNSWSTSSYSPSTKTASSYKADCEICQATVQETFYVDDIDVCKECLYEPSNGLVENIYGFCPFCDSYHTPNLANLFGKVALVVTQNDDSFSVACPECLEPLTELNLNVKVSNTMTLREFILSKLKGFPNE